MSNFKSRLPAVLVSVLAVVGLDQWTKVLATANLKGEPVQYYLNDWFKLTYALNDGAFLSLGSDLGPILRPILLTAFPTILLGGLVWFIFREKNLNKWQVVSLALIVGGGFSNIIDRIIYGKVVDMMQIDIDPIPPTGIFNIADVAIMVGMFMMLPFAFRKDPEKKDLVTGVEMEDSAKA
ncbi:MAG: signal peptidase II [Neolewinella sp.]|jgi:signal peptidase II